MTQEEKELLLVDLCTRLPYGVVVHFDGWNPEKLTQIDLRELVFNDMGGIPKPYLRPLSSMTEEEVKEYEHTMIPLDYYDGYTIDTFDWLNEHHFDYRGLIEKGIAIEAPEDMY